MIQFVSDFVVHKILSGEGPLTGLNLQEYNKYEAQVYWGWERKVALHAKKNSGLHDEFDVERFPTRPR